MFFNVIYVRSFIYLSFFCSFVIFCCMCSSVHHIGNLRLVDAFEIIGKREKTIHCVHNMYDAQNIDRIGGHRVCTREIL